MSEQPTSESEVKQPEVTGENPGDPPPAVETEKHAEGETKTETESEGDAKEPSE